MKKALLISLDSDLGKHMKRVLEENGYEVTSTSRHGLPDTLSFELGVTSVPKFESHTFDLCVYNLGVSQVNRSRVEVLRVNAILACDALQELALCIKPDGHVIVFSSGWGSLKQTITSGGMHELTYRMSKAALNMGVAVLSNRFPKLHWVLMQPGFITTKMNTNPKNLPSVDPYIAMQGVLSRSLEQRERFSYIDYLGEPQ